MMLMGALLLPCAGAASGEGDFLVAGGAGVPAGAEVGFSPLFAFANGTAGLRAFTLSSSTVVLHHFEEPFSEVDAGEVELQQFGTLRHERVVLRDAQVRASASEGRGYLGLYVDPGASAAFVPAAPTSIEARAWTEVFTAAPLAASGPAKEGREDPEYRASARGPHLAWEAAGLLRYEGKGAIKLKGADVHVASRDAAGTYPTGTERSGDAPVREGVSRWALLEFGDDALLEADSEEPWLVAASEASARCEGALSLRGAHGDLRTDEARYSWSGGVARVDGVFDVRASPQRVGSEVVMRVRLEGDLKEAGLPSALVAQGAAAPRTPEADVLVFPLLLGLAVVAGAGGATLAGRRLLARRRANAAPPSPLPFTAEDCREAGAAAASEERWTSAAEWFERGVRIAPTSARMHADLAFALSQVGDHDGALRHYAESSRLSSDGESDFNGALAALAAGRPLAEVEAWVVRALARSPELVMHMDVDVEFATLRRRSAYRRAVAAAWQEMARRDRDATS